MDREHIARMMSCAHAWIAARSVNDTAAAILGVTTVTGAVTALLNARLRAVPVTLHVESVIRKCASARLNWRKKVAAKIPPFCSIRKRRLVVADLQEHVQNDCEMSICSFSMENQSSH